MGLDAATESLRWGVNDLGGTLMEESISRLAGSYHGTRLEPEELVAAAHAPAARPPSAPRCTRSAAATAELARLAAAAAARRCSGSSARANCPWKPNGMWWGSEARASSSQLGRVEHEQERAAGLGVEHDRQQHAVVLAPRRPGAATNTGSPG